MEAVAFDVLEGKARELGAEYGRAAASWYFDGNTDDDTYRRVLEGLENGDPEILDTIPGSPLSGEWADGLTMGRLLEELGVEDPHAELSFNPEPWDEIATAFCDAYEYAAVEEIERVARYHAPMVEAEVGTTGTIERLWLTGDVGPDVAAAVELEHYCDDAGCDIREALENDFPLVAAYLLNGATETPLLDAVVALHSVNLDPREISEWDAWVEHHSARGVKCEACGSYTFGDDYSTPEQCSSCLAALPRAEEDDDA